MKQATPEHENRLIHATSPYLLQHAHNPVDWYEWGEEALAKAKNEDKPIFLSIGYAACHWCHVMEHESFESEEVAALLNERFVSIKVDREERPDIDELYMAYTQMRTGHGGWPMSVFLTSDVKPFFAGTYFSKEVFLNILAQIADAWNTRREAVLEGAHAAHDFFQEWAGGPPKAEGVPGRTFLDEAAAHIARVFDRSTGGMAGSGNKFPPSMAMDLMLRVYHRTARGELYEAVERTLDHMARGGIYDHLGGGICRYSTDPQWLVPHFEKMLYDQAMVGAIYLDAYQVSRNPLYAKVAADILNYVMADLQSPEGGFYSSRDADSEGLEGAYYIWTVEQVHETLGDEDGRLFCAYYDVTPTGNWFEHRGHAPAGPKNILHVTKPPDVFAKLHRIPLEDFERRLEQWRNRMLAARSRRVPPGLDDKILTAWNGLIIASLAKAAAVLDQPRYAEAATSAANFVLRHLQKDGRLLRTYRKGQARLTAYLDDYAFMIEGLLNLYEATFDRRWLDEAARLTEVSIRYYFDEAGGGFFFTASDGDRLLARSKNPSDGAIPSGNSVQAMNLLRLAVLFNRKDYRAKAESIFCAFARSVEQSPYAFERHLCALGFYHDKVKEVALIGDLNDEVTKALLRVVREHYLPNKVLVHASDAVNDPSMPLLTGKTLIAGKPAAYVCEQYRCRLPVTEPDKLAKLLDAPSERKENP